MSLTTTHTNWLAGSYTADLQLLQKIAENNALRLNPTTTNIGPEIDSRNRLATGYGYDLWANVTNAAAELTAAGASIGKDVDLSQGMAVTVEIKTGQRRLIECFLSPLIEAASEIRTGTLSMRSLHRP
jgi:hypothetical protein